MEAICKKHTELPHTTRLFSDLLYQFHKVREFYPHPPLDETSFRRAAAAVEYPRERRDAMVEVLRRQNGTGPALDEFGRDGTVAVVTGQQVGLFSGPCYTIYKALTAVKLARKLTADGIPAVPVFWLATEDHDLDEVSGCWTFDAAQRPVALRAQARGEERPVGSVAIDAPPVEGLAASLRDFPFGEEVAALARQAYPPGATFGAGFRSLLERLLGRFGLLFFDPLDAGARRVAAPFLERAVDAAPDLTARILDRNHALNGAGYHAQVHVEPHTSLFFLLEDGRRMHLRRSGRAYQAKGHTIGEAEMRARAGDLSPNALLRPVMQDYLLPTAAYVGGPAELAYLAQSAVIYQSLLGRMPAPVWRSAFTLLDGRARKLMARYGLGLEDCFHGEEPLREKIAERLVPAALNAALAGTAEGVDRALADLRGEIERFDATLAAALDRSKLRIAYQLKKLERKAAREALRRNERAGGEAAYLFSQLYPHKHLQERFYTILPFLARHGLDLIDRLYDNVRLECPDHILLPV